MTADFWDLLMTLVLIKYLTPDNDVNFEQLERDLVFDSTKTTSTELTPFETMLQLYKADITELKAIAENATFNVSGKELTFNNIRDFLMGEFKKNDGFVHPDTYEFLVPFWTNIVATEPLPFSSFDSKTTPRAGLLGLAFNVSRSACK